MRAFVLGLRQLRGLIHLDCAMNVDESGSSILGSMLNLYNNGFGAEGASIHH
jgi:hypothetical protein